MIDEKRLLEKIDRMNDTVSSYQQDVRTVAQNLLCEISDYIKEQPDIRWIPCSERLPNVKRGYGEFIVTIEGAEESTVLLYLEGDEYEEEMWTDGKENYYRVSAWMEFPEAYLESTKEQKHE